MGSAIHRLLVLLSLAVATTQWKATKSGSQAVPFHTFKISLSQSQFVNGTLTWYDNQANLDLYVYKQGQNLGDDTYWAKFQSSNNLYQKFLFAADETATYYLKVQSSYMSKDVLSYDVVVQSQRGTNIFTGAFHRNYQQAAVLFIDTVIVITPYSQAFLVNYTDNFGSDIRVYLSPSDSYSFVQQLEKQQNFYPSYFKLPATWALIFENLQSNPQYYDLSSFNYTFTYFSASQLADQASSSSTGIIIGSIIGAISIFIILCLIFSCIKKANARNRDREYFNQIITPIETNNIIIPNSSQNLHIDQKNKQSYSYLNREQVCSICLSRDCNAKLPCGHHFHRQCIIEWLSKNNLCPLCRQDFSKSQIGKK